MLNISNRMEEIVSHECFHNCIDEEYNPYDLLLDIERNSDLTSSGVIVWK